MFWNCQATVTFLLKVNLFSELSQISECPVFVNFAASIASHLCILGNLKSRSRKNVGNLFFLGELMAWLNVHCVQCSSYVDAMFVRRRHNDVYQMG